MNVGNIKTAVPPDRCIIVPATTPSAETYSSVTVVSTLEGAFDLDNNVIICLFLEKKVSAAPSAGKCNVATCSSSCFGNRSTPFLQIVVSLRHINNPSRAST